jgi:threonine dehydrogenase-like Zn-dependent dehydrogenase
MTTTVGKAMVNYGPGTQFEMKEYPVPDPEPNAIVTKLTLSSICGSDIHLYKGEFGAPPGPQRPRIGGHEFVGRVYKLGSNIKTDTTGNPLKEGDRVAWCYYVPCGRCPACVSGEGPCPNRHAHAGASSDDFPYFKGGYAEYYYVSPGQWIYRIPDSVPDESAVYVDCAASTVAYALHQVKLPLGATAVIQGAGGLGLCAASMAKDMGAAQVVVVDMVPEKLELARDFGADHTIDAKAYSTPDARIQRVRELTGGKGADIVMELVASAPQVIPEGLEMLTPGGTYLTCGLVGPYVSNVMMMPIISKGLKLIGSSNYKVWTMPRVLDFMARTGSKYPFEKIISHKFRLTDVAEAYKQMMEGKVIRAGIAFD